MLLLVAGIFASFRHIGIQISAPLPPLAIAVGIFLALSSWQLVEIAAGKVVRPPLLVAVLLTTAGAGSVIWSWSLYAHNVGLSVARDIVADLPYKDAVAVYSTERLAIVGPGVRAVPLDSAGTRYKVRYEGLRLLVRGGNGDLFLLPVEWQPGRDSVLRIRDDETIRIDVVSRVP